MATERQISLGEGAHAEPRRNESGAGTSLSRRVVYRGLDIAIATIAITITSPLLLIAAIVIRVESPGPSIFRQLRVGLHKRTFTAYKFRTMRHGTDPAPHRAYVEQLIWGGEQQLPNGRRNLYKLAADDRITRVGPFLRRTSIDELPQLFNVLMGQMSIVGPRPVMPYEPEIYPSEYDARFSVKPGLTGLWQVSGRSERSYREMVAYDIDWAWRNTVARYLWIVVRTPWALLRGAG